MKRMLFPCLVLFAWSISAHLLLSSSEKEESGKELMQPDEFYMMQRSFPDMDFAASQERYLAALQAVSTVTHKGNQTAGFDTEWRLEGPNNIGGRFNSVAIHPTNPNIMYAGACLGGLFKTIDNGQNWLPIFDDHAYLSIGNVVIDPNNPNTIYVGTGDSNINGYVYSGDGLYKSTDGGQTWVHLGLSAQKIISKIIVHPSNSNILYVATMGNPFGPSNDRGLYKSLDGGQNWTQVLFTSNQSGVIDLVMDPQNPNILYAATFDRLRTSYNSILSGPNSKIWKTTDAGQNWSDINVGISLPCGRIGLAISQQNPQVLYASVATTDINGANTSDFQNAYKTTNGGATWTTLPIFGLSQGNFAWYFGQIRVNPSNDNEVWILGVTSEYSLDGGQNWQSGEASGFIHADKHDLRWKSDGTKIMATDGGLYAFNASMQDWQDIENIPCNQIYRVGINPNTVGTYYVGVQDNGTNYGSYQNPSSWVHYFGGDGFQSRFDPNDANTWYVMYQRLGLVFSMDAGQSFNSHTTGIDFSEPPHWDAPFILSKNNPNIQYTATQRVYQNQTGPGGMWTSISSKLTDAALIAESFHTVTTVAESPVSPAVIWAGTTDANVWVTANSGLNWASVHTNGLPDLYITAIQASPSAASTAIVTQSGYRANNDLPHIHKTTNLGQTWTAINGDLPNLAINDIAIYENDENVIFVATDGGIYGTLNGGVNWERVGNNMPILPVFDVEIDMNTNRLLGGTFARSLYSMSLDSLLAPVSLSPKTAEIPLKIFPNPVSEYLQIEIPSASTKGACLHIWDNKGRVIFEGNYQSSIPVKHWQNGIYFVRVENGRQKWVGKCIKQE